MTTVSHADSTSVLTHAAPGVHLVQTLISNVVLVRAGDAADAGWVLVDTGMPGYTDHILDAARSAFGAAAPLRAIVLTHAHFDHVGCLQQLLERFNVPLYAHSREIPHLTGRRSYPPADPLAGGGLMAWSSPLYPRAPIDVGRPVVPLSPDGSIADLPGWEWLHTPGHTDGHIALFRAADRALISGDAVITTKQESAVAVMTQRQEVRRPPAYFTPNWDQARDSVRRIAALRPETLITGHGRPMRGHVMRTQLAVLARRFDEIARPRHGRYAKRPISGSGSRQRDWQLA